MKRAALETDTANRLQALAKSAIPRAADWAASLTAMSHKRKASISSGVHSFLLFSTLEIIEETL